MSCYNWERGTIVIPSDQWKSVREKIIDKANELEKQEWAAAVMFYDLAKSNPQEMIRRHCRRSDYFCHFRFKRQGYEFTEVYDTFERGRVTYKILEMLGLRPGFSGTKNDVPLLSRIKKPKALKLAAKSKSVTFEQEEASISLDNKTHSIHWNVCENNHAVDRAHEWPLAIFMWNLLDTVKWTARSGGQVYGNDEYNGDSGGVGAGGNYLVREFSKKKSESKPQWARMGGLW